MTCWGVRQAQGQRARTGEEGLSRRGGRKELHRLLAAGLQTVTGSCDSPGFPDKGFGAGAVAQRGASKVVRVTGQWGRCLSRKVGRGRELLGSWCGCLGAKDLEYRAGSVDKQDCVDVGVRECGVTWLLGL